MKREIVRIGPAEPGIPTGNGHVPAAIHQAGHAARFAYTEFFEAELENENTRQAYRRAVHRFLAWFEARGLAIQQVSPAHVGEYVQRKDIRPEIRCRSDQRIGPEEAKTETRTGQLRLERELAEETKVLELVGCRWSAGSAVLGQRREGGPTCRNDFAGRRAARLLTFGSNSGYYDTRWNSTRTASS
jgi:hypothetical protein